MALLQVQKAISRGSVVVQMTPGSIGELNIKVPNFDLKGFINGWGTITLTDGRTLDLLKAFEPRQILASTDLENLIVKGQIRLL